MRKGGFTLTSHYSPHSISSFKCAAAVKRKIKSLWCLEEATYALGKSVKRQRE